MDYATAFHKKVYALMRDAYEESFTPGSDNVKTPDEPIMMKPDFYGIMADIAVKDLKRQGMKMPGGFDVKKEAGKVFSVTGVQPNPSTPRVFPELYDSVPFFKRFFGASRSPTASAVKKPGTSDATQDLFQQFKSTHMHMAGLYLRTKLGLKDSDFEFTKKSDGVKKLSEDELKKALLNQYRRYTMSVVLLHLIKLAYEITPAQLDEIMELSGVKKLSAKQLNEKRNRTGYSHHVSQIMEQVFGGQNLGEGILGRLRKKVDLASALLRAS